MAKTKSVFTCTECGSQSPKWLGKCPGCGAWDTLVEEAIRPAADEKRASRSALGGGSAQPITAVDLDTTTRMPTGESEFDRVLGGGIVAGSAVLLGGDPGIGKSTLLLQTAFRIASIQDSPVLYVTAEESARQLRLRAERLGGLNDNLLVMPENNLTLILKEVERTQPGLIIIDSIQMVFWPELESAAGSVGQVRECAAGLVALAKREGIPLFIVGHVTKDGAIAGPKVLEHMVDVVLTFEGDRHHTARILRATKNRYGATGEIGVFEMAAQGLQAVLDPSRLFLSGNHGPTEGSVITASVEGTRPFLVEVQALVVPGIPGGARRRISGADSARVSMLVAVLEKRCELDLHDKDIFINVVGGVQLDEPAADLAIALAIASSLLEVSFPREQIAIGEIGLGGEVRTISASEPRIKEAARLGFTRALLPVDNGEDCTVKGATCIGIRQLEEALDTLRRS
ncbi:MAG: DNA repair protein RadA [Planctomycetota bacterium]|jgi:DNA repair protein RadA/Sms